MSQVNQEFLIRLKGKYTEKYATQMDDFLAIILHEICQNIAELKTENNVQLNRSTKQVEKAADLIKGQVNQVHFDNSKEAFYYGLGRNLFYGITSLVTICFLIYLHAVSAEFNDKKEFVDRYPSIEKFESIYSKGMTITENGYEFLVVYPGKGDNIEFARNYLYDKEKKRVLIPIGTK